MKPRPNPNYRNTGLTLVCLITLLFCSLPIHARPILTEESQTLGHHFFRVATSFSYRKDEFSSPARSYKTIVAPVDFTFGLNKKLDLGLRLLYLNQEISGGGNEFKGSATGLVSLEAKYAPVQSFGFQTFWHNHWAEKKEDLPVGRGDNVEFKALYSPATAWPLHLNAGYMFRGSYESNFGILYRQSDKVDPGNIFEASAAVETPSVFNCRLLFETAYYQVGQTSISNENAANTDGNALDALVGLTWAKYGFDVGLEAGFGLLDESHTSFDLERGAGDTLFKFYLSYTLSPTTLKR